MEDSQQIEINARIKALKEQRDSASDQGVFLYGKIAILEDKVSSLELIINKYKEEFGAPDGD